MAQAAADKIEREIEMFGENFERFVPEEEAAPAAPATTSDGPAKPVEKAKKGKVAAKATGLQYQFQIMESMGVPREEIKKFADPYFWLKYYPPICKVSERSCVRAQKCLSMPAGRQHAVRLEDRLAKDIHYHRREPIL